MVFPTCGDDALNKIYEPKQKRKRDYDPDELTDIEKRVLNLARNNEANQRYFKDNVAQRLQQEAKVKQTADELYWQRAARASNILPSKTQALETTLRGKVTQAIKKMPGGLEEFLVNGFNQNVRTLGAKMGRAESVRTPLIYNRRVAEGIVENVVKMRGLHKFRELSSSIRAKAKVAGIAKDDIDETMALAIELSQLNARRAAYGIGSPADLLNVRRINKLKDRLRGMGMSPTETEDVFNKAIEMGNVLQEARALALSFDVDMGFVENIGYYMRVMNPNAKAWFDNVMDVESFFDANSGKMSLNIETAFNKSRNTHYLIPQDIVLMAHKMGIEVDELMPLLDDPKAITKYFHEKLSADELDDLVDTGLIAKLPMTMDEVYEYLVEQYGHNLPFKGMKEVFLTDPDKAAALYAEGIQRAVGESGMIRTIFKDGINEGWGVPKMEFDMMPPSMRQEFRVIDANTIKQYVPDYVGTESMYVHKLVHDTWKSITDIAVDPSKHGAVAAFFNYFNSIFTRPLLGTPQYFLRVGYSSAVAVSASGGNVGRMLEGFLDMQRVTSKGIDAALDNTKKVYTVGGKLFTEKELYEEFLYTLPKGYNPVLPGTKMSGLSGDSLMKTMTNIPGQMNFYWQYSKAFFGSNPKKVGQLWGNALKKTSESAMTPILSGGAFLEASARWSAFKSLTDTRASNKAGNFVSSLGQGPRQWDSFQSLSAHTNEYFFAFDDVGTVTSFMSRYIRPFAIFAMNNPPATVRHIMRNPHAFINYQRLRSLVNREAAQDEEVQDATVPDYIQRSGPLFMFKDGEKWATLLTNNFDQIGDASSYLFKELPEELQYMYGWSVGNTEKQRSRLMEKLDSKKWFQRNANELLPIWRNGAELLTGIDSATGRPIDTGPGQERESFLFWQPDPRIRWLLSSQPQLDWVDRINPGNMFGRPASYDVRTGLPVPGHEARRGLFNSKRTSRQIDKYDPLGQTAAIQMLRLAGGNVKIIDTAREHQRTWHDIVEAQGLLQKEMAGANRIIKDNPDLDDNQKLQLFLVLADRTVSREEKIKRVRDIHPSLSDEAVRRSEVAVDLLQTWVKLEFDKKRVEHYMLKNNIPPREISAKMRNVNIEDIPAIEDVAAVEVIQTVAKTMGWKENGSQ